MTSTMKAWVYRQAGEPAQCLEFDENYPRPSSKLGGNEVLIQVSCSALNPVGWKSMSKPPLSLVTKKPGVPEFDFSGTVAGGNLEGTGLTIGQEVFGITPAESAMFSGHGTLAEYTVAPAQCVVPKPANISHAEAASFPLAGLTAWAALVNNGQLKTRKSKRVFVNGGSGGVGVYGIQIAKAFGAYVVSTSSPESETLLRSIGADETVDYRTAVPSFPAYLASKYSVSASNAFDLILDTVGTTPALYDHCAGYLVPDGIYLDIAGAGHIEGVGSALSTVATLAQRLARPTFLGGVPRKYRVLALLAGQMGNELREAAALLSSGKIKGVIDSDYSFSEALKAYERQMSGRSKGKVIVSIT